MAKARILPVADLKPHFPGLGNFLSKADFDRLKAILPSFKPQEGSKALLSACLDAIARGAGTQEKMADLPTTLPDDFGQRGTLCADSALGQPMPDERGSEVTLNLWEVDAREIPMTLVNAPGGQTAALDERHNRILWASSEAWRYLGWRFFDPQANRLRILPAELFGPLPGECSGHRVPRGDEARAAQALLGGRRTPDAC